MSTDSQSAVEEKHATYPKAKYANYERALGQRRTVPYTKFEGTHIRL